MLKCMKNKKRQIRPCNKDNNVDSYVYKIRILKRDLMGSINGTLFVF